MRVVSVTTSHTAEQLAEADAVVSSLRAAQPLLLEWTELDRTGLAGDGAASWAATTRLPELVRND